MTLNTRHKHAKLVPPHRGQFGTREWAFVGTACGAIKDLAERLIAALPQYRFGYVDAEHQEGETPLPGRLRSGAVVEYSQQAGYQRIDLAGDTDRYTRQSFFSSCDAVLVNGHHFEAAKQVILLDPAKKASLQKRLQELKDVVLVLRKGNTELYDFLPPGINELPVLDLEDTQGIATFFQDEMEKTAPPVRGLVLAGGRSLRMGRDKSRLEWHRREQRYHLADLLYKYGIEAYVSCRPDQVSELAAGYTPLPDSFLELGPYGALLSAFRHDPNKAWLAVACDLPFFDEAAVQMLLQQRNPSFMATAFQSPRDGSPEPLAAIWEPRSYATLLRCLSLGISCPRKVLLDNATKLVVPANPEWTMNVNTPEEAEGARQKIERQNSRLR